jgi:hypothetical protein
MDPKRLASTPGRLNHPGDPAAWAMIVNPAASTVGSMVRRIAGRDGSLAVRYRIVIRGEINERFARPLEGMSTETVGDESAITGVIFDEAQLVGTLNWLHDRGIEIVSVNPLEEEAGG